MGRNFTQQEQQEVFELIDLQEKLHIDFRTWCGICAMCERILGMLQQRMKVRFLKFMIKNLIL